MVVCILHIVTYRLCASAIIWDKVMQQWKYIDENIQLPSFASVSYNRWSETISKYTLQFTTFHPESGWSGSIYTIHYVQIKY